VVVIGPAHYVAIRGIALPTIDAFETPLGRVPVDRDAVSEIADLPFVLPSDAAHAPARKSDENGLAVFDLIRRHRALASAVHPGFP
jgi:AmmeMemoRadiSam system protein B